MIKKIETCQLLSIIKKEWVIPGLDQCLLIIRVKLYIFIERDRCKYEHERVQML